MADIELVIKLPKRIYSYIRTYENIARSDVLDIKDAILNGAQLPKGHGNLVDMHFILRNAKSVQTIIDVNNAPTIIEADTSKGKDK